MMFKLKEVLIEGKFGPISLGDSKEKVLEVLGEPDDEHGSLTEGYSGVFYGDMEVFFFEGFVDLFHIHKFEGVPKLSEHLNFDPWIVTRNMPLRDFVETVRHEMISFNAFFRGWTEEVIEIRLHELTSVVFDASESPKFQLELVELHQHAIKNVVPILSLEEYL
jgi:hypothetical protein